MMKDDIIETALNLIDREGGFSMRKLAAALGVDPMAIYYYLPNKRAVMQAVVESVFRSLQVAYTADWREQIRLFARAYHELAQKHPNLILHIVSDVEMTAHAALNASETLFSALERAGLSPQQIILGVDVIVDYLNGYLLASQSGRLGQPNERAALTQLLTDDYPVMQRIYAQAGDYQSQPEPGLEIILDGIALRAVNH